MALKITAEEAAARRTSVLQAARWCFLNFGFSKTSLDDIAKRASISRTLLYRTFKDKEDIFAAVFEYWLIARHPQAQVAVAARASLQDRLLTVCRVMVFEPWEDMVGAPMAAEFYDVCDRLAPEVSARHRQVMLDCVTAILNDADAAEVFVLALDGLLADQPTPAVLESRTKVLIERFGRPALKPKRAN
jgi:TetR/AcrR family transcriptional regulator, transcriptional repressor of aconitase